MGPDASLSPELIQAQSFTSAFRGFDPAEVRSFLNRVATEMRAWRERAEQLESAWHSAEERAARPPVLDEDTLMAAVGEETASILRSARAAAADMRTKAAEEAERLTSEAAAQAEALLSSARAESEKLLSDARSEAEGLVDQARAEAERTRIAADDSAARTAASAEDAAARLMSGARTDAAEILEKTRVEADTIRAAAEKDRQLTIEGATSTRDRILEDLARRRRIATVQIEQLRAGRERLIESYAVVRRTLEEASSELSRADAEARAAADDVGRRMNEDADLWAPDPAAATEPVEPVAPVELEAAEAQPAGSEPALPAEADTEADAERPAEPEVTAEVEVALVETVLVAEPPPEPVPEPVPEPEPEPVPEPALEPAPESQTGSGADGPEAEEGSAVDELFARIRATRASDRPTGPAPADADVDATAAGTAGSDVGAPAEPPTGESGAEAAGSAEGETGEDGEDGEGDGRLSDADESLLQRRESAVVDLEVTLTRRLKRALQDEQNDVLDRLRNLRGEPSAARLLPDPDAQTARYVEAARPLLVQAASAGASFAHETLGSGPGPESGAAADVADLASETGSDVVEPLRRRLEQAVSTHAGDDQAVLVEALGAAYREWKTQRIERLSGDVLAAAFSRGTWHAAPEGALLRWVVEDTDGPCPDCDDDALAGELPKGEVFPTGQHHPPAHSGCRCLLVPAAPAG